MCHSFGQLAAMVSEQSEMIQRIDANTYVQPGWLSTLPTQKTVG